MSSEKHPPPSTTNNGKPAIPIYRDYFGVRFADEGDEGEHATEEAVALWWNSMKHKERQNVIYRAYYDGKTTANRNMEESSEEDEETEDETEEENDDLYGRSNRKSEKFREPNPYRFATPGYMPPAYGGNVPMPMALPFPVVPGQSALQYMQQMAMQQLPVTRTPFAVVDPNMHNIMHHPAPPPVAQTGDNGATDAAPVPPCKRSRSPVIDEVTKNKEE